MATVGALIIDLRNYQPFLAGFALYQWLYPQGPGWWPRIVVVRRPILLGA